MDLGELRYAEWIVEESLVSRELGPIEEQDERSESHRTPDKAPEPRPADQRVSDRQAEGQEEREGGRFGQDRQRRRERQADDRCSGIWPPDHFEGLGSHAEYPKGHN